MLEIPVIRFGKSYESMSKEPVVHFETGETLAQMHQANGGLVKMDLRKAKNAREGLRSIATDKLIEMCKQAADLYLTGTLPLGNGTQSPAEFVRIQSATTGLPEHMCASNMRKNAFVLKNMDKVLDALTRGLPLDILSKGYGIEGRGVTVSYQATTPCLGLVLPSNSPGVHTLWLPAIPLQVGLMMKPGSSEPWTPYRMYEAFAQAGVPREAFAIYPGPHDVGGALLEGCGRVMMFGSQQTIQQHAGNPRVQVHGPGFSKLILGDDVVDDWEKYIDIMADSVFLNSGRSCINASGIWASRHTAEIADALAKRLGPVEPLSPTDPKATLAAFCIPGAAKAINEQIENHLQTPGATEVTASYRNGPRHIPKERCDYLRPTIIHCASPDHPLANTEYMFPFASVVECPQSEMIQRIGSTLVCTAITNDETFKRQLIDATNIDRLNIGEVKTLALNWLQPHEGNIIDFLFRQRAFQDAPPPAH